MNTPTLKTVQATLLVALIAFTLACGYSSKSMAVAGTVPSLTQLSPDNATHGSATFTLTVNGSNYSTNAVVNWNGTALVGTAYVTGNQLTVQVPASAIANSGSAAVTVTNPGTKGTGQYGNGGTLPETSSPMSFTIM